jgi:3-hydroxy acid dehydrogenase / malonic semialdehyde reductase
MSWTLITGASAGIGAACARKLAKQRQNLWLIARRSDRLLALAQELGASGVEVKTDAVDVADAQSVARWASQNGPALQKVSTLINNAGLAKGSEPFHKTLASDWQVMIETNISGLLRVTHLVLPHMVASRAGHIVNLGSVAGRWTYTGGNVYAATKAAVHLFSQSLRYDLLGMGVRVSEILPGMVETEFSEVRFADKAKAKAVYQGMTPLSADDIADAVVWCVQRPAHVNISEIVIYPTAQAAPGVVSRRP